MSAKVGDVFFDTCSLWNFAVVDRLDLLAARYGYRAKWTETVYEEIRRARRHEARLQRVLDATWLGDPLELTFSSTEMGEVELIRRALSAPLAPPTKNLGEAELIWYLERVAVGAVLVSDDRPAAAFAQNRGLRVLDSSTVLAEAYSQGEIACPDAYDVLLAMRGVNRGVYVPPDHSYVC